MQSTTPIKYLDARVLLRHCLNTGWGGTVMRRRSMTGKTPHQSRVTYWIPWPIETSQRYTRKEANKTHGERRETRQWFVNPTSIQKWFDWRILTLIHTYKKSKYTQTHIKQKTFSYIKQNQKFYSGNPGIKEDTNIRSQQYGKKIAKNSFRDSRNIKCESRNIWIRKLNQWIQEMSILLPIAKKFIPGPPEHKMWIPEHVNSET